MMANRQFRPLRPAGPTSEYYQDYFTDSTPAFCVRLAKSFVALLREKHPSDSDKWWSQEVKGLSDPGRVILLQMVM